MVAFHKELPVSLTIADEVMFRNKIPVAGFLWAPLVLMTTLTDLDFCLRNTEIDRGADQFIPFQLIETELDPKALGTGPAAQRLR
jgi:hypothetical protein